MRAHGVPNFPDPKFSGGGISMNLNGSGIDPNSPTFQAAQQACQSLLPGANGGTTKSSEGGSGSSGASSQP
ncbi:MAG: hypothetical protein ACLQHS_09130, partial [Candidatus Limnocylindrales bacterium]